MLRLARAQIPPGEHARAGIHVGLFEAPDADREELHELARKVLLRPGAHVGATVEPHEHRRILGDLDEQVAEISQGVLAKELNLTLRSAGFLVGLGGEHARREGAVADVVGDLRVGRREVVVPEERHLLLQRALRMHHPEQPALAGIENVVRRLESTPASSCHTDVARAADQTVHIVGDLRETQQAGHRGSVAGKRQAAVVLDLFLTRAESGTPVEMIYLLLSAAAHDRFLPVAWQSQIL